MAGTDIVGLVPQAALVNPAIDVLRLDHFDPTQILETNIEAALSPAGAHQPKDGRERSDDLRRLALSQFIEAVAAATPIPAGGAVAALAGALASALGIMGSRISRQPVTEHRLEEITWRLSDLLQADGEAYRTFVEAAMLPKTDSNRPMALSSALHVATEIPLEMAERSAEAGALLHACSSGAKRRVQSDLKVGLIMAIAAGGNIYFLAKLGATDGMTFQQMAASMTGMSEREYREMMVAGGRSIEGNRFVGEDGSAQAHRQPQGSGKPGWDP